MRKESKWLKAARSGLAVSLLGSAPALLADTPIYVDSTLGNDSWSGEYADPVTGDGPVKSLSRATERLNGAHKTLYLRCGGQWYGQLNIPLDGITVDRYGACPGNNNPDIRAVYGGPVAPWTAEGSGGKYWAVFTPKRTDEVPKSVWANGQPLPPATFPAGGFQPGYIVTGTITATDSNNETYIKDITVSLPDDLPCSSDMAGAGLTLRSPGYYYLDHVTIGAISCGAQLPDGSTPATLTLASGAKLYYPPVAGLGFYLDGKPWMLTAGGAWSYDTGTGRLYVWMPDNSSPLNKITVGNMDVPVIEANAKNHLKLRNLSIRYGSAGIHATNSQSVEVDHCYIQGSDIGIDVSVDAFSETGTDTTLSHNNISQIRRIAVMADQRMGLQVTGNQIAGVGTGAPGLAPRAWDSTTYSASPMYAGIRAYRAADALVQGNDLENIGYVGVFLTRGNNQNILSVGMNVSGNHVKNACVLLDDCGPIYLSARDKLPLGATVAGNYVEGTPDKNATTDTQGRLAGSKVYNYAIYLDDFANDVMVSGNTITGADYGLLIHNGFNNTVTGNNFWGNRSGQIWQSENGAAVANTIQMNVFQGNNLAQTGTKPIYRFGTSNASDPIYFRDYASYSANHYFLNILDAALGFAVSLDAPGFSQSLVDWKKTDATAIGRESNLERRNGTAGLLVNAGFDTNATLDCHALPGVAPEDACDDYVDLKTLLPVSWPVTLTPLTSMIVVK